MSSLQERICKFLNAAPEMCFSRREIARGLGLKKSPYLVEALETLAERGVLIRTVHQVGHVSLYAYQIDRENLSRLAMFPDLMFGES